MTHETKLLLVQSLFSYPQHLPGIIAILAKALELFPEVLEKIPADRYSAVSYLLRELPFTQDERSWMHSKIAEFI